MQKDISVKVDEKIYSKLHDLKQKTGIPIKRLIGNAITETFKHDLKKLKR